MLRNLTFQQKRLITRDTSHVYVRNNYFWTVLNSKNKLVGLFDSFEEAYAKKARTKGLQILREFKVQYVKKVEVRCTCGNAFIARKNDIDRGHTTSCGCLRNRRKIK